MDIRNVSGRARTIPTLGIDVPADGTASVPEDAGAELLLQPTNWAAATKRAVKSTDPKIADSPAEEE